MAATAILADTFLNTHLRELLGLCGIDTYPEYADSVTITLQKKKAIVFFRYQEEHLNKDITGDCVRDVWQRLKKKYPNLLADECIDLMISITRGEAVKITQTNLLLIEHSEATQEGERP